jgi:hypothetical protein
MIHRFFKHAALAAMLVGHPGLSAAQTSRPASQGEDLNRTIRVWVSGGLGGAGYHAGGGVTLRASANASIDRAVAMFRSTVSFLPSDGHTSHRESSVLLGRRVGGKHFYLIPAIGLGEARWSDDWCTGHAQCTPDEAAQYKARGRVIAYDIGLHASKLFAGVALNINGVTRGGESKLDMLGFALSLKVGAFGR